MGIKKLRQLYLDHQGKVSDKWSLYIDEYDRLFQDLIERDISLLEIGIQNGGSLEIWCKYFEFAKSIVGCDIDPNCASLIFDDSRVHIFAQNANSEHAVKNITTISPFFEIIIDDGSHVSADIVCSFSRYFPYVKQGGLYIVEDLHCSYWQEYQGGLLYPYSSLAFFKRLVDIVNHEHWGVERSRTDLIKSFMDVYKVTIDEEMLQQIHSIEFINSLCVIHKEKKNNNTLQERMVSGKYFPISLSPSTLDGSISKSPNQINNPWSSFINTIEEENAILKNNIILCKKKINELALNIVERDKEIKRVSSALAERDKSIALISDIIAQPLKL